MECFKQFVKLLACGILILQCFRCSLAAEIGLTSSILCPQNSQGTQTAYRPQSCTLTIDVTGTSADNVTKLPLEVKIEIPMESSPRQSCKTLYNGTSVSCGPNVTYRYVKAIVNTSNIDDVKIIGTGSIGTYSSPFNGTEPFNLTSLASNSPTLSPYGLLFNFTSFNGGLDTVKLEVKFTFPIARPTVGETIVFKILATYNTTPPLDSSSSLLLIGTALKFNSFKWNTTSALEAGNYVKVTAVVGHDNGSTVDAKAAQVTLTSLPTGYDCTQSDVTLPNGTKTAILVTSLLSGFTIGNVVQAPPQNFTIEMYCHLTVAVLIQEIATIGITVSYTGEKYPNKPHSLYGSISKATKSIEITANTCNFPTTFHVNEEVKCQTVFMMPLGTMKFQGHCIEATVGPSNESPVEGKASTITPNAVIQYNPNVGGGFTTGNSRRKRAVSPTYTFYIRRDIGILTNPIIGGVSGATVTLKTTFAATRPSGAVSGTLYPFLQVNSNKAYLNMFGITITRPNLQVTKSVSLADATTNPQRVKFEVDVNHVSSSTASASNVVISDDVRNFDTYTSSGITPNVGTPGFTILANTIQYTKGSLGLGQSLAMKYVAGPKGTGETYLPVGDTTKQVLLSYEMQYMDTAGNPQTVKFVDSASVCLTRNGTIVTSTANLYGFAILTAFFGLLAGALIALVIWVLVICVCKKGIKSEVQPASEAEMKDLKSKMRTVMTDHKEAMRKTGNLIKDYSLIGVDESIVFILTMKDKLGIHRELDNLDILSTIHVDQNLDNERNNASVEASTLTVRSLCQNGDVAPEVEAKSLGLFMKNLGDLDKKLEGDYRKELKEILKRLANKNKAKLAELLGLQSQERQKTQESIRDLPEENQKELMELLHQKHQTEQNELAYRLKLEQDEETENLRKEFAIRRRMGIKDGQQHFLDDIARNGDLQPEQIDWLMKEHAKNQAKLEMLYDEEISRQRMVLEEKLARRKQLATETEMQEEEHSALLNTMAGQQLGIIKNMKKEGVITKAEMEEMIRKLKEDMLKLKQKLEEDRKKQEEKLHKELSARKKAKMEAKQKEIDSQVANLEAKHHKAAQAGDKPVDPMTLFESRMTMLSLHRGELNDLENAIDREHATELKKLREGFTDATKDELAANKEKLVEKLREEGMTDAQLNKLLRQHEKELQQLTAAQEEERSIQHDSFKRRLAKNRKNWDKRKLEEKQEQEQLRAHEGNVVRNIIDNQMSMSDAERERILKEHEKQMVKLENSLTLNKLRQKRMLEDKLAKKRTAQMERLEKKQMSESKKMKRRQGEEETEDEDELEDKKQREQINMMKKHAEQKIAILHGDKLKLEDELEEIRTEMMQERALALKEQEERLAAMLASLQLEKAKEMAQIEEQQKAINSLKSNLMDDLTDKGVLSSPECQKVIEIHQKEKEKLNKKLDAQKQKQEKVLRQRLAERMEQKEQALKDIHEKELKEVIGGTKSKAASKIKRVSIMHKHMLEMEKFKNRMDKEMNQTLEDVRRQHEIRKAEAVNSQELGFIAGLVRLGCFQKEELLDVLRMLFPLRQEAEIAEIFTQIYDESVQMQPSKGGHSLAERIRVATSATFDESLPALGRRRKVKKTSSGISLRDQLLGKPLGNRGSALGGFDEKPRLSHRPSKGFISDALAEQDKKPRFSRGGSIAEMHRPSLMESKPHFSRDTLSNRPKYSIAESVIDREMDSLALDSNERPEPIGHNSPEHYERYNTDKEALLGSQQSGRGLPPLRASPRMRNNEFM
ncbi:limbin-like isoform X2 [Lineus longissimus]|uniref:limbin-like isoform X2 n=1 Tax=Lineus longissimus TaxID=88925 RepID=UPI002B4CE138